MFINETDYIKQNEYRINKFAARAFSYVCIIPCIILVLVILGYFNFPMPLAIFQAVFSVVCAAAGCVFIFFRS